MEPSATPTAKAGRRLEFLDGLRGVAALSVLLDHFGVFFLASRNTPDSSAFFRMLAAIQIFFINGGFAVYVFFALSGFVIAQSAVSSRCGLPRRLLARYLRLTAPMIVSLIFAWAMLTLFWTTRLQLDQPPTRYAVRIYYTVEPPTFWTALQQGLYGVYLHGASNINSVVWTMHVELIGSCALYIFYRFCPESARIRALLVLVVVNLVGGHAYLGFELGALMREAWRRDALRPTPLAWLALTGSFLISAYALRFPYFISHFLRPLGGVLVVYGVATNVFLRALLATAVPRFLGRISFCLYLFHLPILALAMSAIYAQLPYSRGWRMTAVFLLGISLSLFVGWLLTVLLDEPLIHRLRHLTASRLPDAAGHTD